jgi:hypothetical protein
MLKEWFASVFTRTEPLYRQLGYVYASVALQARYSRCRKAWSSHIESCHKAILENIPQEGGGAIVVIGSGPLLEVPWQKLLDRCDKLIFVDVVHPRRAVKTAKLHPKIELRTVDVTGFAAVARDEKEARKLNFEPPRLDLPKPLKAVVSANILSQLALEPFAALKKNFTWPEDSYFGKLARKMSIDHVAWVKSMGAPTTLVIADCERIYFDPSGKEKERVASAGVLPAGQLEREWDWQIAPLGEVSRQYSYSMRVECRRL